jgi:hypothetical protein
VSWLAGFGLVLKLLLVGAKFLGDRQLLKAGEASAVLEALEIANARIEKARAARRSAGDGGVSGDDPYLRD